MFTFLCFFLLCFDEEVAGVSSLGEPVLEGPGDCVGWREAGVDGPAPAWGEAFSEDPADCNRYGEPVLEGPADCNGWGEAGVEDPVSWNGLGEDELEGPDICVEWTEASCDRWREGELEGSSDISPGSRSDLGSSSFT